MWNSRGSRMGVVVLDTVKTENEAMVKAKAYRNMFNPRYNLKENKSIYDWNQCGDGVMLVNKEINTIKDRIKF